jgi:hypothetical protein
VIEGEAVAEQRNRFEIYTQSAAKQAVKPVQYESYDLKVRRARITLALSDLLMILFEY